MPSIPAPGRGRLVLVVEDEALIALHLEFILKRHGWRVLGPAASVAQALRLLDENELPDVAVLDVNLQGEPVVPVASALASVPNVGKPIDERRLLTALAQAVER